MNDYINMLCRCKNRGINPKVLIDAGAHFGETNAMTRLVFPHCRVISFEANPNCESNLKQNASEYHICLLGNENKQDVEFYINPDNITSTGCSIYREDSSFFQNPTKIHLDMYKLDTIIPKELQVDFLKMDVQGAEMDILAGAERLLQNIQHIYLEASFVKCNDGAPLFDDLNDYLRSKGYVISDICELTHLDNKLIQGNMLYSKK